MPGRQSDSNTNANTHSNADRDPHADCFAAFNKHGDTDTHRYPNALRDSHPCGHNTDPQSDTFGHAVGNTTARIADSVTPAVRDRGSCDTDDGSDV